MANPSEYIVEVRDLNFDRIGQIDKKYLDLKLFEVFRGIGKFELKLPYTHPLLPDLKTKGAGLIIRHLPSDRVYSGWVDSATLSQSAEDPKGTWLITGVHDNVIAATGVVFPNPAQAADAQTEAYYTATNDGEFLMKEIVRRNIGDLALTAREYPWLTAGTDLNRGATISVSLRFDNIAEALTEIGLRSNLGWYFYQSGSGIVFDVFAPQDKSDLVRLDIRNGSLESSELGWTAPSATIVYVLGQGEGEARTVLPVTSTAAGDEAEAWGLRWEISKDQRNTDDPTELQEAGEAVLTEKGSTVYNIKLVPGETPNQQLGVDWWIGDLITVIIDGIPTVTTVTQVATSITKDGVIHQVSVGDPVGFDWEARVGRKLAEQDTRLNNLETNIGTGDYVTQADLNVHLPPGSVFPTARSTAPTGYLLCDGAAVSRSTYAALFSAIGTQFGTGDGSTTFNVPNLKGRIPVGIDSGQTEFDTRGETGGANTHTLTVGEMPSHTHTQDPHTHEAVRSNTTGGGSNRYYQGSAPTSVQTSQDLLATTATNQNTGGGGAHNNLQPYMALHYIIKT